MSTEDSAEGINEPGHALSQERINEFSEAVDLLGELGQAGLEDTDGPLNEVIERLSRLADTIEDALSDFSDDAPEIADVVQFVVESCQTVGKVALGENAGDSELEQLELLREEIEIRLDACDSVAAFGGEDWQEDPSDSTADPEPVAPSPEEIAALLSGLGGAPAEPQDTLPESDPDPNQPEDDGAPVADSDSDDTPNSAGSPGSITRPPADEVDLDDELREAFMDDATRGLEIMEQSLLDLESDPDNDSSVTLIGRELHTIKGASASIGMSNLANYIHEVEELIRQTQDSGQTVSLELLLPHVDFIRARVEGNEPAEAEAPPSPGPRPDDAASAASGSQPRTTEQPAAAKPSRPSAPRQQKRRANSVADNHVEDETVRVKASQLNRLMDMLSELVMLRNQRDTEISELKSIHDELIHSVTRIRMLSHEGEALLASDKLADPGLADEGVSFSHLNEVANDVIESAQRLRECYQPVADGNEAVSQFIRNFRLELVQLRRMPVSGLFRRLHRAIVDVARTENKQVQVELVGENTGIERSLQERIFEPLLHIVRNSVSHGIERSDDRVANGKSPQGTVRLHAHAGPDLLVIEIRDDGRGLDYDAIRRRGIERGLIDRDQSVSRPELARLIFHSGFSTRETADQISGRGVGMDVVGSTLERMRGWVEIDSENGAGTAIRLSLPLPSMIQHAMVFRTGGQLFALPAQSVRRTGEFDDASSPIDLNEILALPGQTALPGRFESRRTMIELTGGELGQTVSLMVDHVLGPEEVVIRPMPSMLRSHPICMGATLSGMGEVVLLLDPRSLIEATLDLPLFTEPVPHRERHSTKEQPKVLVVDDSKSARLRVARALEKYPVTVVQVTDGQDAIEALSKGKFATVFSDIDMPRMSGLELLQAIKGEPRLASIPVVMISSRGLDTAGTQARTLGAIEYIQKPLIPERFDEIVSQFDWAN